MKITDYIRNMLTARRADTLTAYWATIEKIARGELSERAAAAAADTLEPLLAGLGKDADAVAADVAFVHEHEVAKAEAEAASAAKAAAADLRADAIRQEKRAAELDDEARRLRESAAAARSRASATMQAAQATLQDLAAIQQRLGQAGHPQFVAQANEAAKQREIESLQGELQSMAFGMGFSTESPNSRRATIRARLAELGAKLEDEAQDEPLPKEVGHV